MSWVAALPYRDGFAAQRSRQRTVDRSEHQQRESSGVLLAGCPCWRGNKDFFAREDIVYNIYLPSEISLLALSRGSERL